MTTAQVGTKDATQTYIPFKFTNNVQSGKGQDVQFSNNIENPLNHIQKLHEDSQIGAKNDAIFTNKVKNRGSLEDRKQQ